MQKKTRKFTWHHLSAQSAKMQAESTDLQIVAGAALFTRQALTCLCLRGTSCISQNVIQSTTPHGNCHLAGGPAPRPLTTSYHDRRAGTGNLAVPMGQPQKRSWSLALKVGQYRPVQTRV